MASVVNSVETESQSLADLIWSNRADTESSRRLAQPVVQRMVQEGLCRLPLESCYGGETEGPLRWLEAYEDLSKVEASAAWVAWNNGLACSFGRFVERSVREEVYTDRSLLFANSSRPEGIATSVDGGYLVNGRWTLVSGCELADWFALRCFVKDEAGNPVKSMPPLRFMYVHKSNVQIIDTWNVGGLRGTGSHDIELKNVSVPHERSFAFEDASLIDEPIGRIPICCINSAGCASIALGAAQGALDSFIQLGHDKVNDNPGPNFRDHQHVQALPAKAGFMLGSARAELHRSVAVLWDRACSGDEATNLEYAAVWAASINTATAARSVLSEIYATAGTAAMYTSSPIERAHRDIFSVLQHGMLQPHWLSQAGSVMLGLAPTSPVFRI